MICHNFDAAPNRVFPELSQSCFKCWLAVAPNVRAATVARENSLARSITCATPHS
jgi:hypothetical protein